MKAFAALRSVIPVITMASRAQLRVRAVYTRSRGTHPAIQARSISMSQPLSDSAPSKVNIFVDHTIYKGKGAVSIKLIKPTWSRVSSGSGISVVREGTMLLEFANALSERSYDWENKGVFALSAIECAEVLESLEANREKAFFHDPSKGGSEEGQVVKTLKLTPASQQGFFLNLSVTDKPAGKDARYSTVLSPADARLIRVLLNFTIPRLLGFDEMFAGPPEIRDTSDSSNQAPF